MSASPLLVIGSGLAGLLVARLAAETRPVHVITKSTLYDSNTRWSQGGIAAVWSQDDSVALHTEDTVNAGDGLCDPQAVHILSENSRSAVQQLIDLGTQFDTDDHQKFRLGLEGAHSVKRILHAGGDATGVEIQRSLGETVSDHPNITIHEHNAVTELLTDGFQITGIRVVHFPTHTFSVFPGEQVVLATGGAGQLYCYSSNPSVATGDGAALAYCAGADLMDLEFYQFHPTALCLPGAPNFLITEALRGEGAVLRNRSGERFMETEHPRKELAPRDIVSRAIAHQMQQQGGFGVYLDATALPSDVLEYRFPTIFRTCKEYGIDIRRDRIPVTPVAHYMIGGVATDLWGRTTVPGLYACGEVARTGVHGANRLASNSLLEAAVFAIRVAQILEKDQPHDAAQWLNLPEDLPHALPSQTWDSTFAKATVASETSTDGIPNDGVSLGREEFQHLMWECAGVIRHEVQLKHLYNRLRSVPLPHPQPKDLASFELASLQVLGRLVAESALERRESRGAHYRQDFPHHLDRPIQSIHKRRGRTV